MNLMKNYQYYQTTDTRTPVSGIQWLSLNKESRTTSTLVYGYYRKLQRKKNKMWYKQAHKTIYTNILPNINIKYRKTASQLHIEKMYRWTQLKNSQVNANYYHNIINTNITYYIE